MSNTVQPNFFAGFNLSIGLPTFAYCPSINLELSKRIKPTIAGSSILSSDSGMVALRQNADVSGATFSGVTIGNVFLDLNNATIVTYRRKVDTTFRESCLFGSSNSDDRVSIHAPWSDGNIYFDFSNIGTGRLVVSAPGFTTAPECYVSVASTARGMELWRNGKLLGSNGGSATLTTNIGYGYGLGSYLSNTVNTDNQYIYLHVVYPKALSQILCREISINPWQIFSDSYDITPLINTVSSAANYTQSVAGGLLLVGTNEEKTNKLISGNVTTSGSITKQPRKALSAVLSFLGTLGVTKVLIRLITGALGLSGISLKNTRHGLTGTLPTTGVLSKTPNKLIIGTLPFIGVLGSIKATLMNIAGMLGLSGGASRLSRKLLLGSLSFIGVQTKLINKKLAGVLNFVGDWAGGLLGNIIPKLITATLSFSSGSLVKLIDKQSAGVLSFVGGSNKLVRRTLFGTLGFIGQLTKFIVGLVVSTSISRRYEIVAEPRVYSINSESRVYLVPIDNRGLVI